MCFELPLGGMQRAEELPRPNDLTNFGVSLLSEADATEGVVMPDLFAGLESTFANKLLQSLDYPLTFHIDGDEQALDRTEDDGDYTVRTQIEPDADGRGVDGEEMLDNTIESYVVVLGSTNGNGKALKVMEPIEKDLRTLFDPNLVDETIDVPGQTKPKKITELTQADIDALEQAGTRTSATGLGSLWKKIKKALKKVADVFVRNFTAFLKKYFRFTTKWSEVRIDALPKAVISNPISLNKVALHARVKIEACIKLGKWRCTDITTPWVAFKADGLDAKFVANGLKISAEPSVRGFKFVIKISLFGYTFSIEIGITGIVNKYLKTKGPQELADLTGFEFSFAALGRKFVADSVNFSSTPTWLAADLSGRIAKI